MRFKIQNISNHLKLCLVTDRKDRSFRWLADIIFKAANGGITMVQLREKDNIYNAEFIAFSILVREILEPFKIPLIINDHVDICLKSGAQGVHLGQKDMNPDKARKILGPHTIIGLSVENIDHVLAANKLNSIDYIGASHVFESRTKPEKTDLNCNKIWGLDGIENIRKISKYPIISIGGINLNNLAGIIKAGSDGVAVVSSIQEAEKPDLAAKEFMTIINENLKARSHER